MERDLASHLESDLKSPFTSDRKTGTLTFLGRFDVLLKFGHLGNLQIFNLSRINQKSASKVRMWKDLLPWHSDSGPSRLKQSK